MAEKKRGESMTRSLRSCLFFVALAAIGVPNKAKAEEGFEWISRELATKDYKLSSYEEDGVYYCSTRDQKIIETQFKDGYVLIIFEREAPRFFVEKELSQDLLRKLRAVEIGQFYSVLCLHSSFRDDWQQRYDAEHTVSDRLLNITEKAKELVQVP